VDADINYQDFEKNGKVLGYDVGDPNFTELLRCAALGTKTSFNFTPTIEDILDYKGIKTEKARKEAEVKMSEEEKKKKF